MLYDLVKENRSYRGYKEGYTISEEDLKDLINMARITASGANLQPLKYRIVTDSSEIDALNSLTRWAKMLTNITLPHEGKYPNAYIVVCVDKDICKNEETAKMDIGIAAQTILLGAVEKGLGGCMLGNFDKEELNKALSLPETMSPQLIIAIGKPDEKVVLVDTSDDGSTKYYRDENDIHYVPKRKLEDILIR